MKLIIGFLTAFMFYSQSSHAGIITFNINFFDNSTQIGTGEVSFDDSGVPATGALLITGLTNFSFSVNFPSLFGGVSSTDLFCNCSEGESVVLSGLVGSRTLLFEDTSSGTSSTFLGSFSNGDFTQVRVSDNGFFDVFDYNAPNFSINNNIESKIGLTYTAVEIASGGGGGGNTIPEPSMLALILLAIGRLMLRRT